MRIVQCVTLASSDGAFGGPLAVAIEQCRELARLGHDVTLLAAWDGELELRIPGVRVILARGGRVPGAGFSGVHAKSLVRWVRRNRGEIDVVHVHFGRHLLDVEIAETSRKLRIPYVLQTHGMVMPGDRLPLRLLDSLRTRRLLRDAASVLVLSQDEAAGVRSLEPLAQIRTVRNGARRIVRPDRALDADLEVLFLARLHPRKRVMAFARAAAQVAVPSGDVRYTVVGPDEGDLPALRDFIDGHEGLQLRYDGASAPGTGAARIARADVFVLPSVGEVFPMALLEALAAGTPIVMTSDCAIAPVLERAGAALVTDGSPEELAAAIEDLLGDDELRERLRSAGAALIDGALGAGAVARDLVEIYGGATARRHRVVWITNQAPPYRIPLWTELASSVELEVWLLESDDSIRRDLNNRGDDWTVGERTFPFSVRTIPTFVVKRGEARHYVSGWLSFGRSRPVDSVLLGGWDSPAYWTAAISARLSGARTIGFYESHVLSQHHTRGLIARARRRFFRSLDSTVVPGVASRDALLREGVPLEKLHVGFNAVDVTSIHEDAARWRRQAAGRDDDVSVRILVIGQLIPRKNVGAVIDALAAPGLEDATLTVVGTGPMLAELVEHAERIGVGQRINFLGHVPSASIAEVFASHDVLVHPAIEEVWGLVVNEALAAGLHVVVSDRAGVAPSVSHMDGVAVVSPTPRSIARALRELPEIEPIVEPAILRLGPEQFAQVFLEALRTEGTR